MALAGLKRKTVRAGAGPHPVSHANTLARDAGQKEQEQAWRLS